MTPGPDHKEGRYLSMARGIGGVPLPSISLTEGLHIDPTIATLGLGTIGVLTAACGSSVVAPTATTAATREAQATHRVVETATPLPTIETAHFQKDGQAGVETFESTLGNIPSTLQPDTKGNNFQTIVSSLNSFTRKFTGDAETTAHTPFIYFNFSEAGVDGKGMPFDFGVVNVGTFRRNTNEAKKPILEASFVDKDGKTQIELMTFEQGVKNGINYGRFVALDDQFYPREDRVYLAIWQDISEDGPADVNMVAYNPSTQATLPVIIEQIPPLLGAKAVYAEGLGKNIPQPTQTVDIIVTATPLAESSKTPIASVATASTTPTEAPTASAVPPTITTEPSATASTLSSATPTEIAVTATTAASPTVEPSATVAPSATAKSTEIAASSTPAATATVSATATSEATLTPTPESFENLSVAKGAVDQFVKAMKSAGITTTSEKIFKDGFDTKTITGKDGNTYQVASTKDGYPLMIKKEGGEWGEATLKNTFDIYGGKFGNTVVFTYFKDWEPLSKVLPSIFKENFSTYASDYEFAWARMRPDNSNSFNFKDTDEVINAAKNLDTPLQVRHLLFGYRDQLPGWLTNMEKEWKQKGTTIDERKRILTSLAEDHISTVVKRYKGSVKEWSVVNEPFGVPWDSSFWKDNMGEGTQWIEDMYKLVNKIDPAATLIVNDTAGFEFGTNQNQNAIDGIVSNLKNSGLPVAVGFELHLSLQDFSNASVRATKLEQLSKRIAFYKQMGVDVKITEFDMKLSSNPSPSEYKSQADLYRDIMSVLAHGGVNDITFFNFNGTLSDTKGSPGLFTEGKVDFNKKIDYYAVMAGLVQ